ncbi:type 1 glutamine amidotransferase [Halobacillus yeomjeoni]|uniref:type 1 glutamine amidotransferase domain-containing protein n=1 Tax=Halobacillus yeomjeoni TaxID=311194 RepID=UPI001CD78F49|nr:type 1 glutamine amidotransferase domain-containing protein [Halobacillus yeomjeoni]MCA0984930.1 type 1 glutamine amidotransferase [Halobacillus yeomjeoni]
MSKIACVITSMFEDVEYTKPAKSFEQEGHEVTTIEWESGKEVTGKQGEASVQIDASIDEVKPEDFDALFIPGGFSPDVLRGDEKFVHFAKHFMDENKPVFAICHGPQLLITAKTLEGRKATGFKSIAVDMEYAGVDYKDQEVVVCNNQLVTSRQPDDIPAFTKESLQLLK